ncbi:hypothetical protein [Streptomyces griseorubiginosus]|uniref:hypothetical protein n=1 Tax=Streptomyces griseorubiginosus TaxID=67304 RepID=UPI00331AA688
MTAPALPPAKEFPAAVRFRNGRTKHRVRVPDEQQWWELLEAAWGKTGYKTDAYVFGEVRDCRACSAVVASEQEQAA